MGGLFFCLFVIIGTKVQETLHDFFIFYYYLGNLGEGRWLDGFLRISLLFACFLVYLFASWFAVGFLARVWAGRG